MRKIAHPIGLWLARAALVVAALMAAMPASASSILVTVDTTALAGTTADLAFDLVNGGPPANTVTISKFATDGTLGASSSKGSVTGTFPGAVTLSDGSFFSEYLQAETLGKTLSFVINTTGLAPAGASLPDGFSFFLLDHSTGLPLVTTSHPTGANALLLLNIGTEPLPDIYSSDKVTVTAKELEDTVPPVTVATPSVLPTSAGWNNTNVIVTLSSIDNPGGSGVKQIDFSTAGAQTRTDLIAGGSGSLTISAEGTTTVTYYATDFAGNAESPKTLTLKIDKTPPTIAGLPVKCSLWPPNHKMVQVATVTANDSLSGLASLGITGTSSEPGDGEIVIAGNALGPITIQLRADRSETGTGRIYQLTAIARDVAGNSATATATCVVPHDQGH